jgi:hypothetical protein
MRKTFASISQRASHFLFVKVVVVILVEALLTTPVAALNKTGPSAGELVRPVMLESSATPSDNANARSNPDALTVFTNPAAINVPDFTANSVQSNITVSGMVGTISNVNLTLSNLTSCDANALDLLLVGPGGQKYIFMADVGGFLTAASNVTLTVSDSGASQLPDNGALATGTFRPANYADIGDSFPSPAPAGPYSSAGPEGVPPLTLTNVFGGLSTINGTWSLFVADNIALCGPGTTIAGGWSLDITSAAAASTTTVVSSSLNPSFTNQAVTVTSTTTSGVTVTSGSVTFVDTTTGVTLCSNVAVNGSGQASCLVPANTLSERRHTIQANYGGNATFAPSNGSYVQTVNCPTTGAGAVRTNGCGITIPDAGPTTSVPYPSNIIVTGLAGTISKVTLTLTNVTLSQTSDHNFLLVGPAGQTFVFMSDAGGSVASTGVTWTFDDAAVNALPNSGSIATGTYRPTDYNVDSETWPAPAPAGPYNTAPPNGSSTFASVFGGAAPNGTWSLYPTDDTGSGGAGGSIGSWSLTFTTSGDAPTTTTVSGNPNPSTTAQSFLVTANVTSTSTVNSGTVTFRRGAIVLCATVAVVSGAATCNVPALPQGDYVITADYNGSPGQFNISSGSYTQMVNSPTVVTCNNFANNGGITVTNSSTGNPYPSRVLVSGLGGTISKVTLSINGLTTATPDDLDLLLVGPGGQKFVFMGDAGGSTAISGVNLTFDDAAANPLPDATAISSGTFRPSSYTGFDAFPAPAPVAPYIFAAPEGAGTFANVFNGIAPNGTWSLYSVEDSGDALNATIASWSLTFTLAAVATTTTVTSSANPSVFGQPVTFTATVSTAGLGTPNGNVQFLDGASPIGGPVALNASGQAQITTSTLSVGNHTISVNYAGASSACTGTFNSSSGSLAGGQQVNPANTTTVVGSSANPSGTGQPVTFTATVTAQAPSLATVNAGTVTFSRDGQALCINVAVNGSGQAQCTLTFTVQASYNITAQFSGTTNFNASNNNAAPLVQQVLGPTAANVGISGRVVDSNGQGVYGARVAVQNQTGEVRYAITNPFGYYSITGVPAGQTYLVSVQHKRYEFTSRTISVNEDLTDFDFIAQSEARPESLDNPGKVKRPGMP